MTNPAQTDMPLDRRPDPRLPQPPSRTRKAAPCPAHVRGFFRAVAWAFWRGVIALDDHWIGDLIGVLALFGSLWIALVLGWAVSP